MVTSPSGFPPTQEYPSSKRAFALARSMAANAGRPGLRVLTLPYPLESLAESEVREIARAHWQPLLERLGARA